LASAEAPSGSQAACYVGEVVSAASSTSFERGFGRETRVHCSRNGPALVVVSGWQQE